MCGIAGIVNKNGMEMSSKLLEMLALIQHRGPDASGIAVYGINSGITLRVAVTKKDAYHTLKNLISKYGVTVLSEETSDMTKKVIFVEFELKIDEKDIPKLHSIINLVDGLYVHSFGKNMKAYKDGGLIDNLINHQKIDKGIGTHGIGHVRMATESAEDINAAHPFVSPFYPDLSIVHNGQFTNYFNLRRKLENKGAQFKTLNDSEAASHLIAYGMMKNGGDLEAALKYASEELDGLFCIIAVTSKQMGFVKDKLGIKPLLLFENNDMVLLGSEQIEFTSIFPDVCAEEMDPGEVRVWNI
ncbi:glutamine amidotransferase [Clostridium sp. WILCCON 0269]|uniref:Glutamine amidotransferase n=1 Tax=Candidatus Clostridium eludens TaxID=3381663 RepID=A0ABW8SQ01_9CLOT